MRTNQGSTVSIIEWAIKNIWFDSQNSLMTYLWNKSYGFFLTVMYVLKHLSNAKIWPALNKCEAHKDKRKKVYKFLFK